MFDPAFVIKFVNTSANSTTFDPILLTNRVACSFSVVGSVMAILAFFVFPGVRTSFLKFAFCLSVADLGQEIALLLTVGPSGSGLCYGQAIILSYFTLSTILWPFMMAVTLFIIVMRQGSKPQQHEWVYYLIGWGVPLPMALLPFASSLQIYGPAGVTCRCWIVGTAAGDAWRIAQIYGWVWFVFLANSILYTITACRVRRSAAVFSATETGGSKSTQGFAEVLRLGVYPLILMFAYLPASIDRIQNMIDPSNPILPLQIVHICTVSMCGGLNGIAFLTTPSVRMEIRRLFVRCGCIKEAQTGREYTKSELLILSRASLTEKLIREDGTQELAIVLPSDL